MGLSATLAQQIALPMELEADTPVEEVLALEEGSDDDALADALALTQLGGPFGQLEGLGPVHS
jgi:hypothetical protein